MVGTYCQTLWMSVLRREYCDGSDYKCLIARGSDATDANVAVPGGTGAIPAPAPITSVIHDFSARYVLDSCSNFSCEQLEFPSSFATSWMLRASWKVISRMPITRSKSRSVATAAVETLSTPVSSPTKPKRKASTASSPAKSVQKKARVDHAASQDVIPPPQISAQASTSDEAVLVPAVLSFNFEEAKKHLINVDHRFEDIFSKMTCKPFEILERVNPFR